jgi:predicted N-formylglutamate amidohydrolase
MLVGASTGVNLAYSDGHPAHCSPSFCIRCVYPQGNGGFRPGGFAVSTSDSALEPVLNAQAGAGRKIKPDAAGAPPSRLLAADEPPALSVERPDGVSEFLLVCDHASRRLPRALDKLGLSETELSSHIAWDIGAGGVARMLAERLDATLVLQNYSRLVIDCNRPLAAADSIPGRSEWVQIAANEQLGAAEVAARSAEIFEPYHAGLRGILDQRQRERRPTLLVALHSFTPSYRGESRPWHIGLMYRHDSRMAAALLKLLRRDERLQVGDNQPYSISDDSDYTLPQHGESRGLAHVGVEIRQDLIADEAGQKTWAGRLASLLKQVGGAMAGH